MQKLVLYFNTLVAKYGLEMSQQMPNLCNTLHFLFIFNAPQLVLSLQPRILLASNLKAISNFFIALFLYGFYPVKLMLLLLLLFLVLEFYIFFHFNQYFHLFAILIHYHFSKYLVFVFINSNYFQSSLAFK